MRNNFPDSEIMTQIQSKVKKFYRFGNNGAKPANTGEILPFWKIG